MHKIAYLQKALDDLDEIHMYIANDNPTAADKVISSITNAIDRLKTLPFTGSPVSERLNISGDYRMIIVKPHLIFYRVTKTEVFVYRILHERRYHNSLL